MLVVFLVREHNKSSQTRKKKKKNEKNKKKEKTKKRNKTTQNKSIPGTWYQKQLTSCFGGNGEAPVLGEPRDGGALMLPFPLDGGVADDGPERLPVTAVAAAAVAAPTPAAPAGTAYQQRQQQSVALTIRPSAVAT